ncbi:MAG: type II secretion system protein [Snowella sp.]|nr:type II secretion system protein [Snowella sp.]
MLKPIVCMYLIRKFQGFTLTENLVALLFLTTTLSIMLPAFMTFSMENTHQRMLSGAIAIANNTLEDLRRQNITTVPLGNTLTTRQHSGYSYRINQYVCLDLANVSDPTPTCTTTSSDRNPPPSREILIRIEKANAPYEQIYSVETVFSSLR